MGREASGELEPLSDGRFAARITVTGRTRKQFVLSGCGTNEPEARERCKAMAAIAARLRRADLAKEIEHVMGMAAGAKAGRGWENVVALVDLLCKGGSEAAKAETIPLFKDFADEWTSGLLHKKHPDHVPEKNSRDDKSRLKNYINPYLGDLRLDEVKLSDCDEVLSNLPAKLGATTRRGIAQIIAHVMKRAVYPGRHIAASPIPRGWLPRLGSPKARSFVYPDEDARLLAKTEIPLWRRLLWGVLTREGTRGPSEGLSFRWRHLDLVRGAVRLDANKTDDPRVWTLTPGTTRALLAWKKITKGGTEPNDLVFVEDGGTSPNQWRLARLFRDDLKVALGVDVRPELFEHNAHRLRIRAHDCRASFITVALANGRSETWVTDRTGHTTSGQLRNYRRAARMVEVLTLGDWIPLDEALPELAPSPAHCPPSGSVAYEAGQVGDENAEESRFPEKDAASGQNQVLTRGGGLTRDRRRTSSCAPGPRMRRARGPQDISRVGSCVLTCILGIAVSARAVAPRRRLRGEPTRAEDTRGAGACQRPEAQVGEEELRRFDGHVGLESVEARGRRARAAVVGRHVVEERSAGAGVRPHESVQRRRRRRGVQRLGLHVVRLELPVVADLVERSDPPRVVRREAGRLREQVGRVRVDHAPRPLLLARALELELDGHLGPARHRRRTHRQTDARKRVRQFSGTPPPSSG